MNEKEDFKYIRRLSHNESIMIFIPKFLGVQNFDGGLSVITYCYLYTYRGLNNIVNFSIANYIKWLNRISNRSKGSINHKIVDSLLLLKDYEIIDFDESDLNKKISDLFEITFIYDTSSIIKNFDYSYMYWDEVLKIKDYKNKNDIRPYYDNITTILLLVYFRCYIPYRSTPPIGMSNDLYIKKYPEAYYFYIYEIANDLDLHEYRIKKYLDMLDELNIFKSQKLCRYKVSDENGNDKFYVPKILFANYYKRYKNFLLLEGKTYYMNEFKNCLVAMNKNSGFELKMRLGKIKNKNNDINNEDD